MSITVFVQAPKVLRPEWAETRASIEESDIGKHYVLVVQPEDLTIRQHFMRMMTMMGECKTELVLRLEDDVVVNRHILENLESWPERSEPRFGCGWAFDPGGTTLSVHDRTHQRPASQDRWVNGAHMAYSQATLFNTRDIEALRRGCMNYFMTRGGLKPAMACEQDLAIAWSVNQEKKQICVHAPSLVEHRIDMKSTLDHRHPSIHGTSNGTFDAGWRRTAVFVDRFGRPASTQVRSSARPAPVAPPVRESARARFRRMQQSGQS